MGILSDIVGAFTGSPQRDAAKQQAQSIEQGQDITRAAAEKARADVMSLFPQARQNALGGFQGALDIFSQTIPQQTQAFQGGNVAAQNTLLAGLPQFQNAIFGNQVDMSGFTPYESPVNMSFSQAELPQIIAAREAEQAAAYQPMGPFVDSTYQPRTSNIIDGTNWGNQQNLLSGIYNQPQKVQGMLGVTTQPKSIDIGVPSFNRFNRFGR